LETPFLKKAGKEAKMPESTEVRNRPRLVSRLLVNAFLTAILAFLQ